MAVTRRGGRQAPQRLILDPGAVIALAGGDQSTRALETIALVEVPVVVMVETTRGGPRDAPVNRVLNAIGSVIEEREVHGRTAGRLLGQARSAATVDAFVVAYAVEAGGAHILTGDRKDLERLAAPHPEVWIQSL